MFGLAKYRGYEYGADDHVAVVHTENLPKSVVLFITSSIERVAHTGAFDYSRNFYAKDANDLVISLPLNHEGSMDFDGMEAYIKELEAYLIATGLNDYTLSEEEVNEIFNFKSGKYKWREFSIGELFKVTTSKKRFDANKVTIQEKGYPYVARTSLNNGVRGYITEDTKYLNEANTISFGQDTATMFYQGKQYFTGDKIKILTPQFDGFDEILAQFFIAAMSKSFSTFTWGSSSYNMKIINSQKIKVLVYPDGQPDFERMRVFIKAMEKLVIRGVIDWKDNQIEATKSVI